MQGGQLRTCWCLHACYLLHPSFLIYVNQSSKYFHKSYQFSFFCWIDFPNGNWIEKLFIRKYIYIYRNLESIIHQDIYIERERDGGRRITESQVTKWITRLASREVWRQTHRKARPWRRDHAYIQASSRTLTDLKKNVKFWCQIFSWWSWNCHCYITKKTHGLIYIHKHKGEERWGKVDVLCSYLSFIYMNGWG